MKEHEKKTMMMMISCWDDSARAQEDWIRDKSVMALLLNRAGNVLHVARLFKIGVCECLLLAMLITGLKVAPNEHNQDKMMMAMTKVQLCRHSS